MGFRERIMGWLDRGVPPPDDPHALVEVEDVPLHEGPMLLRVLDGAGIRADGIESFNLPAEVRNRMRIVVRRADAAEAIAVLAEHRRRLR